MKKSLEKIEKENSSTESEVQSIAVLHHMTSYGLNEWNVISYDRHGKTAWRKRNTNSDEFPARERYKTKEEAVLKLSIAGIQTVELHDIRGWEKNKIIRESVYDQFPEYIEEDQIRKI